MMKGYEMTILRNRLRECRLEANIKQAELAVELRISRETIGKLERGRDPKSMLPARI